MTSAQVSRLCMLILLLAIASSVMDGRGPWAVLELVAFLVGAIATVFGARWDKS